MNISNFNNVKKVIKETNRIEVICYARVMSVVLVLWVVGPILRNGHGI